LVYKDRGFTDTESLAGATIAVTTGSTTRAAIEQHIEDLGLDIEVNFQEFPANPDCATALAAGRVDVFSVDTTILRGYLTDEREILDDTFNPQDYGIATRLTSPYLTEFVNDFVLEITESGELHEIWVRNGVAE
jgi:putative glutamine transport system substrate-binding protein